MMSGDHRRSACLGAALLLAALPACTEDTAPPEDASPAAPAPTTAARTLHFTDVTTDSGLDVTWTSGRVPSTQIVEVKGGGVALIDHDGDGDLDVFVPNGATMDAPEAGPGCRLFENLGGLRFRDATHDAGLDLRRWGIGVAVGDYDGDGHDDLYVTCFGRNALLRSRGDGTFEETTEAAGVGGADLGRREWSAAASFGDLDGDGDLDLYVANYLVFDLAEPPPISTFKGAPVFTGPRGLPPEGDRLYENLGDGTFRDVTDSSGCSAVTPAFGLGVVILDFDGDGRQDIYVGNDSTPNFLFVNRTEPGGVMRFDELGVRTGIATNVDGSQQSTMGIAIGDVDGDGMPDVFTTNFSNDSNTMHVNKGGRFFDDETRRYGVGMVSFAYVGWAAGLYDLDLDGDEDLMLFNGHVYPNASRATMDSEYLQPPQLFERDGLRFRAVGANEAGAWLADPHCDRGAAFGDLDGDGDVDAVVVELNGPVRVLRNDTAPGNWLVVELEPTALGAKVEVTVSGDRQTRWIHSGGSFASASAQVAHFGLPPGQSPAGVRITWPDGTARELPGVEAGQRLVVRRDD